MGGGWRASVREARVPVVPGAARPTACHASLCSTRRSSRAHDLKARQLRWRLAKDTRVLRADRNQKIRNAFLSNVVSLIRETHRGHVNSSSPSVCNVLW